MKLRIFAAAFFALTSILRGFADHRVLVIGMDGVGGSYLESTATPQIDALIADGGGSYKFLNEGALVPNPPSGYGASGVNWSTITTGVSAAHHGVVDNSFSGNQFEDFPHFFKYLKDHDPALFTASVVDWAPINDQILADQYADLELGGISDPAVRDATVNLLQTGDPDGIFLHFDQCDAAGHSSGWGSAAYRQAIQNVDGLIGDVMAAVNSRPGVIAGDEDWLVLITADHGGTGFSHNAGQGPINWEVPFVVSGPSVPDGLALTPGTLRDVATTALWHLGVDPFSVPVDGTVQGLAIGPPNGIVGDVNQDGVVAGDGLGPAASDDVTAFAAGWLSTGHASVADAYQHGDLNLDHVTDLADWIILNRLNQAMGAAALQALSHATPEPASIAQGFAACLLYSLIVVRLRGGRLPFQAFRLRSSRLISRNVLSAGVLATTVCSGLGYGALTDELVALYEFEGNLLDTSGNAQPSHAQGVNGPQYSPGKIGQALWLPGLRDYVSLPGAAGSALDFGSTVAGNAVDFTMAMWVRQDDYLSDPAVLSNKDWSNGGNTGVNWAVQGNGIFDLNTKGDVGVRRDLDTATNSATLPVGSWNLVVMTVDRDGPTRLYLNGANTGTIPQSSTGDFNGGLSWNIGQDGTGTYGVEFTGAVDELAIWRRALDASEATTLWNGGAGISLSDQVFDARLKLIVDRDSGNMRIVNNTGQSQNLLGYQITSAAGAFNRDAWTPISGRLDATGDKSVDVDDRWLELTASGSKSDLSEVSLGEGAIPSGVAVELGAAWRKYYKDAADVTFLYATPTDATPLKGIVEFVGNGGQSFAPLDLNHDGAVSGGDYAAFLTAYGQSLSGESAAGRHNLGDLNGDGKHSLEDFLIFKAEFDAVRGPGAFSVMIAGAAVPELSALALLASGVVPLAWSCAFRSTHWPSLRRAKRSVDHWLTYR